MTFLNRLSDITRKKNSLLCVGLDPDTRKIPNSLKTEANPLLTFCSEIIESTQHAVAAFKINFAFFEAAGSHGWAQLEKILQVIPTNILKIADAKRGDIGSSSEMYARAILENLDFDAVTVSPYMGRDSVEPFLRWPEKGAFILCLTSNPGANDFQHFSNGVSTLFENVIEQTHIWNSTKNCGLVVGATHPKEARAIRIAAEGLPFLVPGVGTQGGDLESAVLNSTDAAGDLALFNSSRGIIYSSSSSDFASSAGKAAEHLRSEINRFRTLKSNENQQIE